MNKCSHCDKNMSLKKLLEKAKTSKQIRDEMLEPSKKYYNNNIKHEYTDAMYWKDTREAERKQWISLDNLISELKKFKKRTGKEWAWYFYKELGYRIVEDGETELALKRAMNKIFELSEEKNPIEVLHESIKRNDGVLKGLSIGSKKKN